MAKVVDILDLFSELGWEMFEKTKPDANVEEFDFDVLLDEVQCTPEDDATFQNVTESKPVSTLVFTSVYDGRTKNEQQHSFNAKRSTVATATMEMTERFTKGFDVGFMVKVSQIVAKATSGFGHEVVIKTETTHIFQKQLLWSIDSPVKVSGNKRLEVKEEQYTCNVEGWVVLKGKVKIRVSKDGDFVMMIQNKIGTILEDRLRKDLKEAVKIDQKTVRWPIKGSMTFNYGVSQNVDVSEVPIPKEATKAKADPSK